MKHTILLSVSVGLVFFFILLNADGSLNPTGAAIIKEYSDKPSYTFQINDRITQFFNVEAISFPRHTCTDIARELYSSVASQTAVVTAGYKSTGIERVASINYVIDWDDEIGTFDMVYGKELLADYAGDSMLSLSSESLVRVPKSNRANYFTMDLFGTSEDQFYVTNGRFSTPSLDCLFGVYRGEVICDCNAHSITGIEVAGITSLQKPIDYIGIFERELLNKTNQR